jgi:hypothetical protein
MLRFSGFPTREKSMRKTPEKSGLRYISYIGQGLGSNRLMSLKLGREAYHPGGFSLPSNDRAHYLALRAARLASWQAIRRRATATALGFPWAARPPLAVLRFTGRQYESFHPEIESRQAPNSMSIAYLEKHKPRRGCSVCRNMGPPRTHIQVCYPVEKALRAKARGGIAEIAYGI